MSLSYVDAGEEDEDDEENAEDEDPAVDEYLAMHVNEGEQFRSVRMISTLSFIRTTLQIIPREILQRAVRANGRTDLSLQMINAPLQSRTAYNVARRW